MTNQDRSLGIHFHLALLIVIIIARQQSADCNVCHNSFPVFDHALSGHVIKTVAKDSFDRCIFSCELDSQCYSVNFHAKGKLCEFNLGTMEEFEADFVQRKETIYINMVVRRFDRCTLAEPCRNGGSCEPHPVTHCLCPEGFSGSLCEGLLLFWWSVYAENYGCYFSLLQKCLQNLNDVIFLHSVRTSTPRF